MRLLASFTILALATLLAAGLPATSAARPDADPRGPAVERGLPAGGDGVTADEITVRFKPGITEASIARLNARAGVSAIESSDGSRLQRVKVPGGKSADAVLAAFRASPLVAEAGLSRNARILDTPNDPKFSNQWHLRSTDGGMWADTAWDLAPNRGAGVTVAVIDTGVAYESFNGSLGGSPQTFVQAPDLAEQRLQRSAVVDHVVGGGKTLGAGCLRRDDAAYLVLGEAAAAAHAGDLLRLLTPARMALFRAIKSHPGSITAIAARARRDRSAVTRDVAALSRFGLVQVTQCVHPGHGHRKEVRAGAEEIRLEATVK